MDISNLDQTKPKGTIDPFYWISSSDNSLYLYSKNNGHIELEGDLPPAFNGTSGIMDRDPKVSGQISIRGSASDNNIIDSLWVYMDGFNFAGSGTTETIHGRTYARAAFYSGNLSGVDQWTANGWKMTVTTLNHDQEGHKVTWQLDVDTTRIAGVAAVDRIFRIIARDQRPAANTPNEDTVQTSAAAKTNYYRMDVVPYVTGIETPVRNQGGLKNNNIRSADGRYSVIQGTNAAFIAINGFNLNPGGANAVQLQSAGQHTGFNPSLAPSGTTGTSLAFTAVASNKKSFSVTNNSPKSGYLTVYTRSGSGSGSDPYVYTASLNNINNNDSAGSYNISGKADDLIWPEMPNREADRYTTKNIRLTDDRYLQFYTVVKTDVKNGYYPTMLMNGDNPVFGYLDLTGGPGDEPAAGAGGGAGAYYPTHAMPQRAEFHARSGAALYKEYLIKASIWDGMGMARDESGRYIHATTYNRDMSSLHLIYDRYAELYANGQGWGSGPGYQGYTGAWANFDSNNAIALEAVNLNGLLLDRYQYPKLMARGNSRTSYAAYYMAYYDDGTGSLVFRNFRIGNSAANVGVGMGRLSNTGSDAAGNAYGSPYTNIIENFAQSAFWNNGRLIVASGASRHFDMGVTSGNIVIIAYYDESLGKLQIKYSAAAVTGDKPNAVITWNDFGGNSMLPEYTGAYVSMAIDSANGIHLAVFDAVDSDLKYIYIPAITQANYYAVTVDQYGSLGNWTQIRLNGNVPYIAYYNATETGGRDAIKLAYAKNAVSGASDVKAGVGSNGYTTGNWEYMTVPTLDPPQGGSLKFQKVNLGFNTRNEPVLGYLGTNIEFSYPVSE
jgi:hypothetical protein